jgi:phosphate transport system substrate-binding protein
MKNSCKLGAAIAIILALVIGCSTPIETPSELSPLASPARDSSTETVIGRATQAITVDGSSTVYPISDEAKKRYQRRRRTSEISVAFSGTGGGFKKFCNNQTDINNASRPILQKEIAACAAAGVEFVELPIAFDALSVVAHPDNNWVDSLTVAELKKIWEPIAEGKITQWNQIRPDWPERPLKLFGRGKDSGTYDFFTTVIVGQQSASRSDYIASEDVDFLVNEVSQEPNALAFFGIGSYVKNWEDLKSVAIDSGKGPVYPSLNAVRAAEYNPLSRPLFLYVNADSLQSKPQVQTFLEYYLQDMKNWVTFTGYMPLNDQTYQLVLERLRQRTTGTAYGGQLQTDITVEEAIR